MQDHAGDENFNVYAVNPADARRGRPGRAGGAQHHRRQGRARVDLRGAQGQPDIIYVGLNDRDAAWHDLYKVTISTGERKLMRKNTERDRRLGLRPRRQARGWRVRTADNGDTEVLRVDRRRLQEGLLAAPCSRRCGPLHFHKDGERVYMETNKGDADLIAPRALRSGDRQGRRSSSPIR